MKHFALAWLSAWAFAIGCEEPAQSSHHESSGTSGENASVTDQMSSSIVSSADSSSHELCAARVWSGDVQWPSPGVAVEAITRITGDLQLRVGSERLLDEFRCLEVVDGNLHVSEVEGMPLWPNDGVGQLTNLREIGGELALSRMQALVHLDFFPHLTRVGESVVIAENPNLVSLQGLDNLQRMGGQLLIGKNPKLVTLEGLGSLIAAQEVLIIDNDALASTAGIGAIAELTRLKIVQNEQLLHLADLHSLRQVRALVIGDNPNLHDLTALLGLQQVHEELELRALPALQDLNFLGNLGQPAKQTVISSNEGLVSLRGLQGMQSIPAQHEVVIEHHPRLVDFQALASLETIAGSLTLRANAHFDNLAVLARLRAVHRLAVVGPDALSSIEGLAALRDVTGELVFARHDLLHDLQGLPSQVRLARLHLNEVAGLTSIAALSQAGELGGIHLESLPSLSDLTGVGRWSSFANDVVLRNLQSVQDLQAFAGLTHVSGYLIVEKMDGLHDLQGLNRVESLGGLVLAHNPNLQNLQGIEGLHGHLQGPLCIHQNAALKTIEALSGLQSVAASLTVTSNPLLAAFNGLHAVKEVGASFWLDGNSAVQDLQGFRGLRKVGGQVWSLGDDCATVLGSKRHGYMGIEIRDMQLSTLSGLENLAEVGGGLMIKENPELVDLSALFGATVNGQMLEVRLNPKLEQCQALQLPKELNAFAGEIVRIEDNLGENQPECDE